MSCRTVLIAAPALLAGPAVADTLQWPQEHTTVQAAIDAAQPGDVVLISGGPYAETVVIDARDGITLKGKGKPSIGGVATDVLTVRGGSTDIVLDGLVIENSPEDGVLLKDSTDITIRRCEVRNVDDGIRLESSTRVLVEKSRLENIGNDAMDMDDVDDTVPPNVDCRILKNRISNPDEDSIDIEGPDNDVINSQVRKASEDGIEVGSDTEENATGNRFEKNNVTQSGDNGFKVSDGANEFAKNKASKSFGFDLLDESGTTTDIYDGNKFGTQSGP